MDLKELLGEELYNQVQEKMGNGVELLVNNKKESTYIPKSRLDTVLGQKKILSDKIDTLEIQLQEMKADVSNVETLKTQLQTAQDEIATAKNEVINVKKEAEIKFAIVNAGAKKSDLVAKLLAADKINIKDDGTVEGLEEQIATLKKEVPELFAATPPPQKNEGDEGNKNPNGDPQEPNNTEPNPTGGTGKPGNGGEGKPPKTESIGAKLAKKRATQMPEIDYFK